MDTTPIAAAIFPIYNPSGGVGKTTTTINLGATLVRREYRVLAIDLDATHGLTRALKADKNPRGAGLSDALVGEWTGDPRSLIHVHQDGLHVIPTDPGFSNLVERLSPKRAKEWRLRQFLAQVGNDYDVILLDCPPTEDLVTDNALLAGMDPGDGRAAGPIIPVLADPKSWESLEGLFGQIEALVEIFRVKVEPMGLVINAYDKRDGKDVQEQLAAYQRGELPVLAVINRLKDARVAWKSGRPVVDYAPDGRVTGQYGGLVDVLVGAA